MGMVMKQGVARLRSEVKTELMATPKAAYVCVRALRKERCARNRGTASVSAWIYAMRERRNEGTGHFRAEQCDVMECGVKRVLVPALLLLRLFTVSACRCVVSERV